MIRRGVAADVLSVKCWYYKKTDDPGFELLPLLEAAWLAAIRLLE
jgi:hypothetical protein